MLTIPRRQFLIGSALPALVSAMKARAAGLSTLSCRMAPCSCAPWPRAVAADYARLLGRLADDPGIEADEYSRHGVVASLEARFAALLGKDMAVYLPTGTLANHWRSGVWPATDAASWCSRKAMSTTTRATALSSSAASRCSLVPGRATFTLAGVEAELRSVETGRVHRRLAQSRSSRRWPRHGRGL